MKPLKTLVDAGKIVSLHVIRFVHAQCENFLQVGHGSLNNPLGSGVLTINVENEER